MRRLEWPRVAGGSLLRTEARDVDLSRPRQIPLWLVGIFGLGSLHLVSRHAMLMWRVWPEWRAGAPDVYPHAHATLLLGAASGILVALIMPIPLLAGHIATWRARRRWAIWGFWALLFGASVVLTRIEGRLLR